MRFGVVILAAGASQRMGRAKMLLRWRDTSVLGHLRNTWGALEAAQICVVHSASDATVQAELDRLGHPKGDRISNPQPETGMFGSIQCAALWKGWDPDLTHWLLTLGDQPHLRWETLKSLVECAIINPDRICQPALDDRPKHPAFFPKSIFRELGDASETNLKEFLTNRAASISLQPASDPGLDFDLDTPADYQEALRRFAD